MANVNIRDVRKSYGNVEVLHGVSIEVEDGEFVALVGPSGCGKSTLLRMIAGLEPISGGTVSIDGRVVNALEPKERDIAMVFQSYALYPHMNVFDNMAFSLKLGKVPTAEIQRRVGEAAEILALTELLGRFPRQLSGGQRQRVAMGRAIVRKPKVFLFDEPLSNLDAKLRVSMRTEIKSLHQRLGTTAIYVTHDQVEAMTMADKIVVMNGGRIEQMGRPMDLYEQPQNLFVAGFVGSPGINLIEGSVVRTETGPAFDAGAGLHLPLPQTDISIDAKIIYGVRPQDFVETQQGGVHMDVSMVEPTGAETFVYGTLGSHPLCIQFGSGMPVSAGGSLSIAPRLGKVHLFDKDTSQRLVY